MADGPLRILGAEEIDAALTPDTMVDALAGAFRGGLVAPSRHHHGIRRPDGEATLLLMPAWDEADGFLGVKVVTVFPGNGARGLGSVQGTYLLMDGATGRPLAALDGARLTLWRTAGASALAARHLARSDARRMVMVGAGTLAPFLIRAHAAARPIREVAIWNRRPESAARLAAALDGAGLRVTATEDLEGAVREADLVSCATLSREPLVRGAWLKAGAHLDLVGAFTLAMREADDAALTRGRLFVDTPDALVEGGDVAAAIRAGTLAREAVAGDLAGLCRQIAPGRSDAADVTVFKSIGASLEDLAAATAVWRAVS